MTSTSPHSVRPSPATAAPSAASDPVAAAGSASGAPTVPLLRHNAPYLLLMGGLAARALGIGIAGFAVPLVALAITGDVLSAGLVSAIGGAGYLLATLPAGVVADRVDRRRLILGAAAAAAVLWLSAAVALGLGSLHPAHLAAVSFGSQIAAAFIGPAGDGGLRAVVPAEQLPTARAAVEGRESAASLISGPLGGLLYSIAHALPLLGSAIGNLVAAAGAAMIRRPLNGDLEEARRTRPARALADGVRYVAARPLFVVMIALAIVLNTASNGSTIAVTLDLAARATDPFLIGLLSTMIGASLLAGSFVAPAIIRRVRTGVIVPAGIAIMSAAFLGMAAFPSYGAILGCYAVAYLLAPALNASLFSYAAVITPEQMQGRFSSVTALSGAASVPLAPLVGSGLLSGVGLAPALLILALTLVVVAGRARPVPAAHAHRHARHLGDGRLTRSRRHGEPSAPRGGRCQGGSDGPPDGEGWAHREETPMTDSTPHSRHADDARADDAPPTPVVSDEVSEAAADAGNEADEDSAEGAGEES